MQKRKRSIKRPNICRNVTLKKKMYRKSRDAGNQMFMTIARAVDVDETNKSKYNTCYSVIVGLPS